MNRKVSFIFLAALLTVALVTAACGKKESTETAPAPTTAAKAQPVDPATAAVISGTVKLEGTAPKGRRLRMDADPGCAALHKDPVTDEEVVVGEGNALANVVVYVKSGLENRSFDVPKEPVVLDQKGCQYHPRVVAVMTNQKIEVLNSDTTTHNIHPTPQQNREWNKSQPPGATKLEEAFAREEISIPVKCNVHPWMKSYIAVIKNPYHAVMSTTGSFELKNLPPGDYTIEAWHEKLGKSEQKITVGPKETKSIEFVFKAQSGD
jgi:plastocyanin